MPHLSKHAVDPELLQKLFSELERLIGKTTEKESSVLLNVLLTNTEKIMLTKRLAAALMFSEGKSQYLVWNTLKFSPSTSQRLYLDFENGKFDSLIKIAKKSSNEQLWSILEIISRGGMPSMGNDRWKILD